ncbi:alpha/beta fold hydrolase [Microbacterium oleivorans]|uniref:Alpha/beta hydrolase n=1 Tax=Microbacterium oleivorans TaxID=273677 RepID=A0A7D5IWK3_9MICO|nr:alpha/beta hydrolase [Microbacterium oleivorans]QLD11136.1 alpha/beta hydrolase [Microbacterium oleivorans]
MIAAEHGSGVPLIAIHGFGVDHRILLPLEDWVADRPWRRVYLDLPWAERAIDRGLGTPREVADAVREEVETITAGGPFAIIGNSFGAMVARHVAHALRPRCRGLATLAGVFELDHDKRRLPPREVVVTDQSVLDRAGSFRDDFAEMAVVQTADALAAFEEFVLPGLRGADADVLDRISSSYSAGYAPEHTEAAFTAPSLHVFGRQDNVVGFEDGLGTADHYVRGTFVVLDGAGHNVHLERPDAVAPLVRDWLLRAEQQIL